ncbi:hypothetical protein DFH06DRAFT_1327197 [Mycena polygramma]|nr:hypothetical protein DFH06DRAFT_1327197 [Mycena polygramma]
MHDCLKIAELVDMICSQFDCSSEGDRRALATVARTCMTFRDPALDRLWWFTTLGQLLVYCMPSDLWAVDMSQRSGWDGDPVRTVRLLRPIFDSDWQRVRLYAPRIRKLASGEHSIHHRWDLDQIFPSLSLAFSESLLHNLQDLQWYHTQDDFHYIHIFLRPSLTKISFYLLSTADCSLLPRLGERCPQLVNIAIAADPDVDLQPLSRFVARLPLAETISVPWLQQDALEHLSKLPTLKSLTMGRCPKALPVSAAPIAFAFTALRHMSLNDGTLADVTLLLRMCRDVSLETLRVDLDNGHHHPPEADVQAFVTAVAESISPSRLTRLRLQTSIRWWGRTDPLYLIQPDTLTLLICFKNLTFLDITCAFGFDLDDDTVSQMARAWPQIQTLRLAGILPSTSRPRATLASLCSIARHCPRIVTLTLAFDGSVIPSPCAASPGVVVRNESLRQMNVLHSPITTPITVGRFLFGVFPNLYRITTSREGMDDEGEAQLQEHEDAIRYHRCWTELHQILQQKARVALGRTVT